MYLNKKFVKKKRTTKCYEFRAIYADRGPLKKMPTIEIAGLCLPLKPQKERRYYNQVNIDILKMKMQLVLDRIIIVTV